VAGFVATEDLSDVAVGLNAVDDGAFEETVLEEVGASTASVVVHGVGVNADGAVRSEAGGSEVGTGNEEGAEAVPVAFAGRAGDNVVERGHNTVDGFDVIGFGGRGTGEGVGAGLLRGAWCGGLLLDGSFLGGGLSGGGLRNGKSCGER